DEIAEHVGPDSGGDIGRDAELGEGDRGVDGAAAGGDGQVVEETQTAGGRELLHRPRDGIDDGDSGDEDVGHGDPRSESVDAGPIRRGRSGPWPIPAGPAPSRPWWPTAAGKPRST